MTIALYTNALSTHQLPLAKEIVKRVGEENFRYIYTGESGQKLQESHETSEWIVKATEHPWLEKADVVLVGGIRPIDLMARRAAKGLKTLYQSERWFKPIRGLPGSLRMLVPGYRKMAKRFVRLANENECVKFLAIGPHAWADFVKMGVREEKLVKWGYFVEPSRFGTQVPAAHAELDETRVLRVLWAGRDLAWKRVKDIEKAVKLVNNKVERVGGGGQRSVIFTKLTGVSPAQVREAMREHDVFVMASNAYEGWGAVASEALEEGMNVIGTWECGACPTLLPKERLYHCGDVKALARLLALEVEERGGQRKLPTCSIGEWTAGNAMKRLLNML